MCLGDTDRIGSCLGASLLTVGQFLEGLHVSFDFDGAQARLQECKEVRNRSALSCGDCYVEGRHLSVMMYPYC